MRFLAIGDILAAECLGILETLDLADYAFLLQTGDMSGIPNGWRIGRARGLNDAGFIPAGEDPKEYYGKLLRPSVDKLQQVDKWLGRITRRIRVLAVYGNTDFVSVVEQARPKNIEIIHKKVVKIGDISIVGYNGHPMYPWEIENPHRRDIFGYTLEETARELNSFREEDLYSDLTNLTAGVDPRRVVVLTHTPPYGILDVVKPELVQWAVASYGEKARTGNVGSTGLKRFIIEYKPLVAIFGHIHESKGIEIVGDTTCVNVGAFDQDFLEAEIANGTLKCDFKRIE
jgi:Icc-related predicted phosphoesterase